MNPIQVGDNKQLFIDDRWFAEQQGMTLTVNPPLKGEIVLRPDMPWETRSISGYSNIIEHDGRYKMWYDAMAWLDDDKYQRRCLCYAESDDGLHWERQNVNLFEWEGIRENNIVIPGTSSAGVMIDPNGPDEHRFKALCVIHENEVWAESKGAVTGHWDGDRFVAQLELYLCTSPDGIHWKRQRTPVDNYFHDTHNHFFYDTRLGKYAAYFRTHERGRTVGRLEVDDPMELPWVPLEGHPASGRFFTTVLSADDKDPPDTDLYTPGVHPYPWADEAYFALTTPYRHYPVGDTANTALHGRDDRGRYVNDGPVDVQLAVSRDGVTFSRPDRRPYVPLGLKGDYDGGQTYIALGMIRRRNEIWMYDAPTPNTHGAAGDREHCAPKKGMRRLVQRLDGFMSADAAYEGAEFTTPLLTFGGAYPKLNVNCSAVGQVWVEVRDEANRPVPGYTLADSIDVERNQIAAPVYWRDKDNVGDLIGRPVRLHFKLQACKLYAFQFDVTP